MAEQHNCFIRWTYYGSWNNSSSKEKTTIMYRTVSYGSGIKTLLRASAQRKVIEGWSTMNPIREDIWRQFEEANAEKFILRITEYC